MITLRFDNGWTCRIWQPICNANELVVTYWVQDNLDDMGIQLKCTMQALPSILEAIKGNPIANSMQASSHYPSVFLSLLDRE